MKHIYSLAIAAYVLLIHLASLFSPKAKLWVNGRKNWRTKLHEAIPKNKNVVWFHCASLGEFEQARPIMEAYTKKTPGDFLLLTFFSPSGYEIKKNYPQADYICYMPADLASNAADFVRIAKPTKAVFVKYEFWYNFMEALFQSNCKTYLIAARFRVDQPFFKWYGNWFVKQLQHFYKIHLQDLESAEMLSKIGYTNFVVSGDPRFDRVIQNADASIEIPEIKRWLKGRFCMVAGSAWPADEKIFLPWTNFRALIIAPHEIDEAHLKNIESSCGTSSIRYSKLIEQPDASTNVLIIDNIGMLMRIYAMAEFAYVGGGFGTGLHNILEPAAFGIPVAFGPKHEKFPEAQAMIHAGGAMQVSTKEDFTKFVMLMDDEQKAEIANCAGRFVRSKVGATELILNDLIVQ